MEKNPAIQNNFEKPNVQKLFRGIYASELKNGDELPVGGSIFSEELTTKLRLDFEHFESEFESLSPEKFKEKFEVGKSAIIEWLEKVGTDVDPFIFAACMSALAKVEKLLEVRKEDDENTSNGVRFKAYSSGTPNLSDLIGNTACAERAALGQYILQKIGVRSSYMSGVSIKEPTDGDTTPEDHSFIVIDHEGKNYIFDIARPRSGNNLPRVLEPVVPFNYNTFENKKNLLIKAKEVLQGGELYFGVGSPTFGHRNIISESK